MENNWTCGICGVKLSRKQRLISHYEAIHPTESMPEELRYKKRKYKEYVTDPSAPVPKRTLMRQKATDTDPEHEDIVSDNDLGNDPCISRDNCEAMQVQYHNDSEIQCHIDSEFMWDSTVTISDSPISDPDNICAENYIEENISESRTSSNTHGDSCQEHSTSAPSEGVCETVNKDVKLNDIEEKCMAILSYISKFKLTGIASEHLLRLLKLFAPQSDEVRTLSSSSINSLIDEAELIYHDVCKNCNRLFPKNEDVIRCEDCNGLRFQGPLEKQSLKRRVSGNYFVTLPLKSQLRDILERDGVFTELTNYRQPSTNICDITSSDCIQEKRKQGEFLNSTHNLSLLFNTDGVPLYSSSSVSIWPVFLVINELPPAMRFSQKNMLLWGLWQSTGKPKFQTFLQRFVEDLTDLHRSGVSVTIKGQDITVKAELTVGTMDLQAKAYVMEMTQHNGQFGCLTCEEPGTVCKQGKGHCRGYPYPHVNPPAKRSTESVLNSAEEALQSGKVSSGIKDVSVLFGLPYFDPIKGLVPDYMHGVLLGTTKKLLQLWFSPSSSKQPYHLGHMVKEVDKRLSAMKPTDEITRMPRNLETSLQHMKASELQNWLLHYSVPCLDGIMENKYMENLCYLVEGVYILLGDSISQESLDRAGDMLRQFYITFEQLYGTNNCGLNIHNIGLHLVDYVKLHGPLWAWSCFPFEDMNGLLVKSAHGTGDVCRQLLCLMKSRKRLLTEANNIKDPELRDFTNEMLSVGRVVKTTGIANNCKILGTLKPFNPEESIVAAVGQLQQRVAARDSLAKVMRIQLKGNVIYSESYQRMQKRISHVVLVQNFEDIELASVQYFVYEKQSQLCFAVCEKLRVIGLVKNNVNHLVKVSLTGDVCVVPVNYIAEKVLFLNGNEQYSCISRMPNLHKLCC